MPGGFRESRRKKIDERPHLGGQMPAARIHRVNVIRCRPEIFEYFHQCTRFEHGINDEIGFQRDSCAGHSNGGQHLAIVGMHTAINAHLDLVFLSVLEAPLVFLGEIFVSEAVVIDEIIGVLRGSLAFEIFRP